MSRLDIPEIEENKYNAEPVYFCTHCLSLRVKNCEEQDFCDNCSSTDIDKTNIRVWEQIYYKRYGKKYL